MKRRFLYFGLILALFVPIFCSIYQPQQASAANGVTGTGNNLLQLVGEHCHDLNDITHDFGIGSNVPDGKGACHEPQGVVTQGGLGWEEVLNSRLNCSSDMFYQHPFTDPNDPSITTKTLWYTHIGEYKDCYNKAQNMFNNMTKTGSGSQCDLAGEGSQNYTNCLADVTNLHDALGCSTNMLQKTNRKDSQGNYYYTVDPNSGAVKDCQQRIDDVGKIQIVIFDGNGNTTQSKPISDPSITVTTPDSPNDNQGSPADNSCEASGGGFSLNWALCEVYQGIQAVVNWMFGSVIEPLLVSTPICLPGNSSCDDTIYQIWSNFRIYGDIFLVITLLVIVFGESIGGGMIEAYTAKKVLPRLLAAAILLNLSIYLMAFMIDMTNIVGGGIGQLLTGPLNGQGLFTIHPGNITAGAIFAGAGGVALLAGFTAVNVTGIALMAVGLAITGLIAVMAVFFTLIIRQAIIIGLVLVSPVAFALWCLPNTEKWFKRWWDTFFQMLLVYPMVVVLFAVADIMSYLTAHNGGGGSFANNVVAFMLLLIPLYLVPFTLRSSNRLMGAIQGAASNVGRQINAISGRRALSASGQEAAKTFAKRRAGEGLFRNAPVGSVRHRLNTGIARAANIESFGKAGLRPRNMRSSLDAAVGRNKNTARRKLAEESDAFQIFAGNDDMLEAAGLLYHDGEQAARTRLEQGHITGQAQDTAIAQLRAAQRQMGGQNLALTAAVANAGTGTGYAEGPGQAYDAIARAAGGDMLVAGSAYAEARGGFEKARRFDALEGFAGAMQHMADISSSAPGAARDAAIQRANSEAADAALEVQGIGAILGGRGQSARNLAPALQRRIQHAEQAYRDAQATGSTTIQQHNPETGTIEDVTLTADQAERNWIQTMASTSAAIDSAGSAAPEVQRLFADTVHNGQVDLTAFPPEMRDILARGGPEGTRTTATTIPLSVAMNNLEDQDAFAQMKKVYSQRFQQDAAAAAGGAMPGAPGAGPVPGAPPPPVT